MAQPSPIFVTPSTTVVQVTTLPTYIPVILNSFNYQGQVVTVLDGTSSLNVLNSSIVVSTPAANTFSDGSISTLINQPQGFLTLQSQSPNLWVSLNSFPFRNQYISAGLYTATTSNFTTATLSTTQTYTNTLNVEKIIVSGNFLQSSPIVLNQTVSSLGTVDLYSTVSVWESSFFSSGLSTIGAVQLFSTLTVDGNLTVSSSLRLLSTVFISGSVSVVDYVSAALVSLSSGLHTKSLIVTQSTATSVDSGGGLFVGNTLTALSTVNVGGDLTVKFTSGILSFSTLSSLAIGGDLVVQTRLEGKKQFSTQGTLSVTGHLSSANITALGNLEAGSNLLIGGLTDIGGFVSTQQWTGDSLYVKENMVVNFPTVVTAESLNVNSFLTTKTISSASTFVAGLLSTTASVSLSGNVYGEANLSSMGTVFARDISTLSSVQTGSLSTVGNIAHSGQVNLTGNLAVLSTSFWNMSVAGSTSIYGDLNVFGNMIVNSTLTIYSSITLPDALIANNFFVSSLFVGDNGIVQTASLSNIQASSIGTGGVQYPAFTMDMDNQLTAQSLSTYLLSSLLFEVPANATTTNTFFHITSSLGVGLTASTNTFAVNPLAYTTCNLYALSSISTLRVLGGRFTARVEGDGSLLSNTQYPAFMNICTLQNNVKLVSDYLIASTLYTSTMNLREFIPTSTMNVGDLRLFGNPNGYGSLSSLSSPFIAGVGSNQLYLNPMLVYGTNFSFDVVNRGAIINSNRVGSLDSNYFYTLRVGDTMRVDRLAPYDVLFYQLQADKIYVEGEEIPFFYDTTSNICLGAIGETYISSGLITLSSLQFLPENTVLQSVSTNSIQPFQSTLSFNSTLYVNRLNSNIGVQNPFPNFTLDVKGTTYVPSTFYTYTSTVINGTINKKTDTKSLWIAISGYYYNLAYSETDGASWTSLSFPYQISLCNIATNGGGGYVASGTFLGESEYSPPLWVAVGLYSAFSGLGVYYATNPLLNDWSPARVNFLFFSPREQGEFLLTSFTNIGYNGQYWLATAFNNPSWFYGYANSFSRQSIFKSSNGIDWNPITSGGFQTDPTLYVSYAPAGGRAVAWNGSVWVAVGVGYTAQNCIQYSSDGETWVDASVGFQVNPYSYYSSEYSGGYSVVWTGKNFVAGGYTGNIPNIIYSGNGITWSNASITSGSGLETLTTNISWNGSRLVASGEGIFQMFYSDDHGSNWSVCSGDIINVNYGLVWNGSYWLASGSNGVSKSIDGISWTYTGYNSDFFSKLAYNSNTTPSMAVGNTTLQTFSNVIAPENSLSVAVTTNTEPPYYSSDGINWTMGDGAYPPSYLTGVAYSGSRWVAVGVSYPQILYSDNGITWQLGGFTCFSTFNPFRCVFYANGRWVAGIDFEGMFSISIYYSNDGNTWDPALLINGFPYFCNTRTNAITYGTINAGAYNGAKFFCVGEANTGQANAGVSSDGINWEQYIGTGFFDPSDVLYGVIYAGGQWIVCGTAGSRFSIMYSADGDTWNNASFAESDFTTAKAVAYNGSDLYVAVGDTAGPGATIKWSADGQTWTNALSGAFTNNGYSIAYNAGLGLWIAGGDSGVLYSSDGKNWSAATGISVATNGVATSGTAITVIQQYYGQVRFYNNPLPGVASQLLTPYISYTNSNMDINTVMQFDTARNVTLFQNELTNIGNPLSSFINAGYTNVRQTLSSPLVYSKVITLDSRTI